MGQSRWKLWLCAMAAMVLWLIAVILMPVFGIGGLKTRGTDSKSFIEAARTAADGHRGNLAIILIEDGKITQSHASSIGKPVSGDTMFQMASVSKWITAWGVMTLADAGRIELDAPVARYLTRWKLPQSEFPDRQVTVRRLLSHTAGLSDDLGYCGFVPGTPIQTLEASLTKAADACPLRTGVVRVDAKAGSWRYSGGGYALLQLMIEEVSGEPFADYMERAVFAPLGMTRSTYRTGAEGYTNLADFYDGRGGPATHYRFTASAAASLYSTANDMARFVKAHMEKPQGTPSERLILSPQSLKAMRSSQAKLLGTPYWGLGVQLYTNSKGGGLVFGHDGFNGPAVNTSVRIDDAGDDAIIALSTGGSNIASSLGSEWTRQRRDGITPVMVYGAVMRLMNPGSGLPALGLIVGGWIVIIVLVWGFRWRQGVFASGKKRGKQAL